MRVSQTGLRYAYIDRRAGVTVTVADLSSGARPIGVGQDARWSGPDEIWWRPQDDSGLWRARVGDVVEHTPLASGNSLAAAGARICRHRTDPRRVLDTQAAAPWDGAAWPVLSDDGQWMAVLRPDWPNPGQQSVDLLGHGGWRTLHVGHVTEGTQGTNFRMAGTSLCFQEADGRVYGIVDVANPTLKPVLLARAGEGVSHAVPVYAPGVGLFVLHIRPASANMGRVCLATWDSMALGQPEGWQLDVSGGGGYEHDARTIAGSPTEALVAWMRPDGGARAQVRDLTAARVPLVDGPPAPFGVGCPAPRALGYFYDFGRYGDWTGPDAPARNVTIVSRSFWDTDDHGTTVPDPDADDKLCSAIEDVGAAYISTADIETPGLPWDKVLGLYIHEPGTPAEARTIIDRVHAHLDADGRPRRPIVVIIGPQAALDPAWAGVGDALAPEIYLDAPGATYQATLEAARLRTRQVLDALSPSPLHLVVQAYDRSSAAWKARPDTLQALQQAANEAAPNARVLGLWWFAFDRPGGTTTYPDLETWHAAQVAVTAAPPLPVDPPKPPDPPDPQESDMTHDEIRAAIRSLDDPIIFGALQRFHNEVLPRDRPVDPVTAADGGPFNTADVVTGGAFAYFVRTYVTEVVIAIDKGRTPAEASGDGYDLAIQAYRDVTDPQ